MSDFSYGLHSVLRPLIAAGSLLAIVTAAEATEDNPSIAMTTSDQAYPEIGPGGGAKPSLAMNVPLDANAYVIGDRLKIAFFEKVDVDGDGGTAPDLIERVELSGEYVVQDDGSIFLPILGSVNVVGQNPRQLEARLADAFKSNLGRHGKASIVVSGREPVYVVGTITKPGTHRYTPGMTVMHAIALSEGMGATYVDFTRAAESIRERERLDKSARQMQLMLARRAALVAERDGQPAEVPARLVEISGKEKARTLVDTFAVERRLAFAARDARKKSLQATIGAAKHELELLRTRLTHVEESIKNRSERVDTVAAARNRGTVNDHAFYQVRGELSDVLEREDAVKASLAQTEEKLAQAQHEIAKLEAETRIELYRELTNLDSQIAEEDLVLLSSERLIRAAGNVAESLPLTPDDLTFVITRRTAAGPKRLAANAMSMLQAGDLLEISRKPLFVQN
jgi:protein involved in polysaccharide export with SLBB domain